MLRNSPALKCLSHFAAMILASSRITWAEPSKPEMSHVDKESIQARFEAPRGFSRVRATQGSFGEWLRALPLKPGVPKVMLFDGTPKRNQTAHAAVIDLDIGKRDLQQCADAVMRLRAEYLWSANRMNDICFRFTSGDKARWTDWRDGARPQVNQKRVAWKSTAKSDDGYFNFRDYLDKVFEYAGTASLRREMLPVCALLQLSLGDVFIQPGFPGHAVIVVDVAKDARGQIAFLLAQSYMPAQDIHVLKNPQHPDSPWYFAAELPDKLVTPEWEFPKGALHRFSEQGCPSR